MFNQTQKVQENKYNLPYHHLITISRNHFSQYKNIKWGYEYSSYISFIVAKLKDMGVDNLIDVGCGDGKFLNELNKRIPNKKLTGVDYSKRAIQLAKAMTPDVNFIHSDITNDKSIQDRYNQVTLIETLEHIPLSNISSFISSIKDLMLDNGRLIITVPSDNIPVDSHHFQHYNMASLEKLMSGSFEIINYFYINKISRLTNLIAQLFSNKFFILNNKHLKKTIYNIYLNYCFFANKNNARRICIICKKK